MSAAEALRIARAAGVTVTSDGQDLSLAAPTEPPAAVLDLLRLHKPAIIDLLQYDAALEILARRCPDYVEPRR